MSTERIFISGGRYMSARLIKRPSAWVYGVMLLPAVLSFAAFAIHLWIDAEMWGAIVVLGLGLWALLMVIWGWPGRFLALILILGADLLLGLMLAQLFLSRGHMVLAPTMLLAAAILWVITTLRIGSYWGGQRYQDKAARGRGILEWEWVYVGRNAALGHPMAQRLGWIHAVALGVALWALIMTASAITHVPLGITAIFGLAALMGLAVLTIVLIYRKHPAAWVMVWFFLLLSFPFSLPFMIYWTEGRRPNLIYRHRYERLVSLNAAPAHAPPSEEISR